MYPRTRQSLWSAGQKRGRSTDEREAPNAKRTQLGRPMVTRGGPQQRGRGRGRSLGRGRASVRGRGVGMGA